MRDPAARAGADLLIARIQLYDQGDATAAANTFRGIKEDALPDSARRNYRLTAADLVLYAEGYAAAVKRYAALSGLKGLDERRKMQLGGALLNVRNALVMKRYDDVIDYLDRLEQALPEMRLRPDLALLRGQAMLRDGKPRRAEAILNRALCLEPDPDTAAAVAFELAGACRADGRKSQAGTLLKRAIREAPQSRTAATAARMLEEINEEK